MSNEAIAWILGIVVGGVAGSAIGIAIQESSMQRQAIERNFAEYDAKTGEWKWRENGGVE